MDDYAVYYKYMSIAASVAKLSRGRNTKVGCVLLSGDKSILSVGYNGAPRGCNADVDGDPRREKPEKYYWICHAEVNAITNAARNGTPLNNCIAVVTHHPCMDCARALVQIGVKAVITRVPSERLLGVWSEHIIRSEALFTEVGVQLLYID